MKKIVGPCIIGFLILLAGCGTGGDKGIASNKQQPEVKNSVTSPSGTEENIKIAEGREIIAELKQTTKETQKRDEKVALTVNQEDLKSGAFGTPTPDLEEQLAIQGIEGRAAIDALEQVYGGYEGVENAGVVFFEWKSDGAKQSGFWIGIKNPDEKLTELVTVLQKQVDEGEILAEHIYIYQSPHTQNELNTLTSTVGSSLQRVGRLHEKPNAISFGASVNTITGVIEINHNYITEDQKEILRKEFIDHQIEFTQDGRLVPIGDEPDITYPSIKTTSTLSTEGSYVVSVTNEGMLVVDAKSMNYGVTGGVEEHFSAVTVLYPNADKKLEVGQRVVIEYSGGIQMSYPGQGRAKYVEVLPEYKPNNAKLSESQVVQQAMVIANSKSNHVPAIRSIQFDEISNTWKVVIKQEEDVYDIEIKDKIQD